MSGLGKTPWVDRHLRQTWAVLSAEVPANLLPQQLPIEAFSVEEYGCGYFGCVMPTASSSLVVKITTDESEAWFAYVAMQLAKRDDWPPGIVRYHKVLKLEGRTHKRRPIYLLWRDEAWDVGFLSGLYGSRRDPHDLELTGYINLITNLMEYDRWTALALTRMRKASDPKKLVQQALRLEQDAWQAVAEQLSFRGDTIQVTARSEPTRNPAQDFAFAVRACATVAQFMANTYANDTIGMTLEYYIDAGLLISDLHAGNIGRVQHPEYEDLQPGITDPGLAIPTQLRWFDVRLPQDVRLYTS